MQVGNVLPPKLELVFCKSVELFTESIPGKNYARRAYYRRTLSNSPFVLRAQAVFYKSTRC
jgi:hypothetical protein